MAYFSRNTWLSFAGIYSRACGLSPSGVIWGGNQDAKDGGLDVVIENIIGLKSGFIPRSRTGFQVKKPDMPRAAIIEEMRPKGELRNIIRKLINERGSYIIVSSTGSTTAKALDDRRTAIRDALKAEADHENLHVDFYDRGRVATWVRTHPSLILWVRNRLGKGLRGWRPFENWTQPGEVQSDYIIDQQLRLYNGTIKSDNNELSVETGLNRIRSILLSTGRCVRLAGLSGVGKTRFVQALFDETIGEHALNSSQVVYTDISNGPDPDPRSLAEQLIAQKTRAILVVDNCPPDIHRKLTEVCSGNKSTLSLITVEYDVREDLPDETYVFRLEPASDDLINKLIKKRFKHISDIDAQTITEFSGGNARIAIALANTVHRGETLSTFQDEELFERLFRQRKDVDSQLLKSAQALALVYSFEGAETSSQSELSILASLISKTAHELYSDVTELRDRDLIQVRSVWRAVLPQAIANRLAKKALNTIPVDTILTKFVNESPERLFKSFTRRLSYLHDCETAVQIADHWLAKGGLLGDAGNLNNLGINILENITPVSPVKALEAIERASQNSEFVTKANPYYDRFIRLLRALVFDEILFVRSARIICRFALNESVDENRNSTRSILKSLFLLVLSGTHASIDVRYSLIEELFSSNTSEQQDLGLLLLDNALEAWHFNSHYGFDFGARPRDYGYRPKTSEEVKSWYKFFLDKIVELILLKNEFSHKVKKVLADNFRSLWTKGGLYEELEDAIQKIKIIGTWGEGWIEVRKTIYYDKEKLEPNVILRLEKISEALRPVTLPDLIKTYVLPDKRKAHALIVEEGGINDLSPIVHYERAAEITKDLGVQLTQDATTLDLLLPDLLSSDNFRLWSLGQGMAKGCHDKKIFWKKLRDQFSVIDENKRSIVLLSGFINEVSQYNIDLSNELLDNVLTDPVLKNWSATFQMAVPINSAGVQRLYTILDNDISSVDLFYNLATGRKHETISDEDLAKLIFKISSKENGQDVALEILGMRFHGDELITHSQEIINIGQSFLKSCDFSGRSRDRNLSIYYLDKITEVCLIGEKATEIANSLCHNLNEAFGDNIVYPDAYGDLLAIIAEKQPDAFLNTFIHKTIADDYRGFGIFSMSFERHENPLDKIVDEKIISWCETDPQNRYPALAQTIAPFSRNNISGKLAWKPVIAIMLNKAPSLENILPSLENAFYPSGWSDSLADVLQTRVNLLQSLFENENSEVIAWAKSALQRLEGSIKNQRERDDEQNRPLNVSFE